MPEQGREDRGTEGGSTEQLVRTILASSNPDLLRQVIDKSIAVSSGKGGVGKTITASNLAVWYARKGLRVGLVDLDPLSDVASLLDLHESEEALEDSGRAPAAGPAEFGEQVMPVFKGLEILFPFQKLAAAEARSMMDRLYRLHLAELNRRYDVLLFDMPAGMGYEDNLAYVPFMKRLVLVTNPEPTAHASAGAYAKQVQKLYPGTAILLWHNRFSASVKEGFHPRNVAGNYNRLVVEEDRLTDAEMSLMQDFAFVPEDPALDLLQGEPSPTLHALKSMRDSLSHVHGRLVAKAAQKLDVPRGARSVVASYIQRHPVIGEPGEYVNDLSDYLRTIIQVVSGQDPASSPRAPVFNQKERGSIAGFLKRLARSALLKDIVRLEDLLETTIRRMEESRRKFSSGLPLAQDKAVDRELGRLLVSLNDAASRHAVVRSHGVLLLFHFSLYKLFQSPTILRMLRALVPRRKNRQGRMVRDRFRQIRTIVEGDPAYRARYLKVLKTLLLILTRQLVTIGDAFELPNLLLRDKSSRINSRAYLTLLTAFLHEALYSGLSIIVGFDYRSTAVSFSEAAERLLASLSPAAR
ncbi:MAG TPA: P-loop NTPase [Spirochaetia bacterium]|nr:P-loop NTPase [Spirochaetia bacterium]